MSKSFAVASGADAYVEPIKEDRPDFKELKKIEKQRREILLRVSFIFYCRSCVGSWNSSTNTFFSISYNPGWAAILEDFDVLVWDVS